MTNALRREVPMTRVRRRVGQRVRRLDDAALASWLARYNADWNRAKSIVSEPVKELTGGLNSQSINAYVVRRVYDEIRARRAKSSILSKRSDRAHEELRDLRIEAVRGAIGNPHLTGDSRGDVAGLGDVRVIVVREIVYRARGPKYRNRFIFILNGARVLESTLYRIARSI